MGGIEMLHQHNKRPELCRALRRITLTFEQRDVELNVLSQLLCRIMTGLAAVERTIVDDTFLHFVFVELHAESGMLRGVMDGEIGFVVRDEITLFATVDNAVELENFVYHVVSKEIDPSIGVFILFLVVCSKMRNHISFFDSHCEITFGATFRVAEIQIDGLFAWMLGGKVRLHFGHHSSLATVEAKNDLRCTEKERFILTASAGNFMHLFPVRQQILDGICLFHAVKASILHEVVETRLFWIS
ncbi:AAEL000167-PA [Aedes aegypti]|uniref:AAEL000167-PA n=1 Tax=Aedes aegypti TaxID=7159 RepID=Q17PW9_AEDAE|nr:AAEL000167-PA [Aedes aegypti]